jgi:hypothetical protein
MWVYVEFFTRISLRNYPDKSGSQPEIVYLSFSLIYPNTRHVGAEVSFWTCEVMGWNI